MFRRLGSGQLAPPNATAVANAILFAKWACLREARSQYIMARLPPISTAPGLVRNLPHNLRTAPFPRIPTMESRRPKGRENTVSALTTAIDALSLAKEISSITPATAAFGSVNIILTTIRVSPLLIFCRPNADRNTPRTRWLTKWITLSLDWPALTSVPPWAGD